MIFGKPQREPSPKREWTKPITKEQLKWWLWKKIPPDLAREVFKGSPEEREKIWNELQKYWPDSLGSLDKNKLYFLKRNLQSKIISGTLEESKAARKVLNLIEALEKNPPAS